MKFLRCSRVSIVLLILLSASGRPLKAQSEVAPDHFEMNNVEPYPQPHAKPPVLPDQSALHFRGKFNLPYSAECAGRRLAPGKYSLALQSEGKDVQVTVSQKGRTIRFAAHVAPEASHAVENGLVMQRGGAFRRVAAIDLRDFNLILCPGVDRKGSVKNPSVRTERLPIT